MACVTFPYFLYLYMKNLLWNPGKLGSQSHINLVFPNEGKEAISSLLHEILDKRHFIRLWQSKLRTTCVPTSASSEKKFGILKRIIRICLMKRSLTRRFSLKWCMRYSLSSLKRSIKKKKYFVFCCAPASHPWSLCCATQGATKKTLENQIGLERGSHSLDDNGTSHRFSSHLLPVSTHHHPAYRYRASDHVGSKLHSYLPVYM